MEALQRSWLLVSRASARATQSHFDFLTLFDTQAFENLETLPKLQGLQVKEEGHTDARRASEGR